MIYSFFLLFWLDCVFGFSVFFSLNMKIDTQRRGLSLILVYQIYPYDSFMFCIFEVNMTILTMLFKSCTGDVAWNNMSDFTYKLQYYPIFVCFSKAQSQQNNSERLYVCEREREHKQASKKIVDNNIIFSKRSLSTHCMKNFEGKMTMQKTEHSRMGSTQKNLRK